MGINDYFFCSKVQTVNTMDLETHMLSALPSLAQNSHIHERAYLCANKALFTKKNIGLIYQFPVLLGLAKLLLWGWAEESVLR